MVSLIDCDVINQYFFLFVTFPSHIFVFIHFSLIQNELQHTYAFTNPVDDVFNLQQHYTHYFSNRNVNHYLFAKEV